MTKRISEVATISGLAKISTGVGKHNAQENFVGNRYTHCKKTYEHILRTPYKCLGATFGWARATQEAIEYVNNMRHCENLTMPISIIGGSEDVVVDIKGWSQWSMAVQSKPELNVQYHLISGARHELFSEIERYRCKVIELIHKMQPNFFRTNEVKHSKSA